MRIISWNVNGLRSAVRKGFVDWVKRESPDILCLQEVKIQESEVPFDLVYLNNYHTFFNTAQKKGYSGVMVYSKMKPLKVRKKLGLNAFDREGRLLELKFKDFTLINLYIPHGARDKSKMPYKLDVYGKLMEKLGNDLTGAAEKKIVLTGDFNIAHTDLDLARPKENITNTMFTFPERIQLDKIEKLGFVDSFRTLHEEGSNYSWWPYYPDARERNIGWRIDYVFVSSNLRSNIKTAFIMKNTQGSDHCPIGVEIEA